MRFGDCYTERIKWRSAQEWLDLVKVFIYFCPWLWEATFSWKCTYWENDEMEQLWVCLPFLRLLSSSGFQAWRKEHQSRITARVNTQETIYSLIKKHIQFIYKYFVSPRKAKFWKQCFRNYFENSSFCFHYTDPAPLCQTNDLINLKIMGLKRAGKVIMTFMWNFLKYFDMGL